MSQLLNPSQEALLERAVRVIKTADFGPIAVNTEREYRRVGRRILVAAHAAGPNWGGLETMTTSPGYLHALRSAWARWSHTKVAAAVRDLRERRVPVDAGLRRLAYWVPQAEAHPPRPGRAMAGTGATKTPKMRPPTRSKRGGIRVLESDWVSYLWTVAAARRCRHLDALAVVILTGCRPSEVCGPERAVLVRLVLRGLELTITGAKVTGTDGQPWRALTVALEGGAAAHLEQLARRAGGEARVSASCSPNAFSMMVTDLGEELGLPVRVSAYDLRHQRSADIRTAFDGDLTRCAAWMGHSSDSSLRHYGRLPKSAGIRGARPLDVEVPRVVRRHVTARELGPRLSSSD
jgi:integrase